MSEPGNQGARLCENRSGTASALPIVFEDCRGCREVCYRKDDEKVDDLVLLLMREQGGRLRDGGMGVRTLLPEVEAKLPELVSSGAYSAFLSTE